MKPTIHDVAKHAGVSVATVSRYLNHSPLIAPASIEKVQRSIEALNYQPNMMARGLARRSTETVAMVVDYSNEEIYGNEFFLRIQFGLERELARNGFFLMIVNAAAKVDAPEMLKKIILEERVDGIVLLNEMATKETTELLLTAQTPFVVAGRSDYPGTSWVDVDNVQGGYLATRRLIKAGASSIGFITNSFQKRFVAERFEGYKKAMSENGRSYTYKDVAEGISCYQDQLAYLTKYMDTICDAYVVTDSYLAYYFVKALSKRGLRVPDDVQIVAFDNQLLSEISEPGLTVVDIDVTELGVHAARILLGKLSNAESDLQMQELLPARIIERRSTR